MGSHDAIVIGSGPNGMAAAITLARAGKKTLVLERDGSVGGSTQSANLTLPGFIHDRCAAILALGAASPVFQSMPLGENGVEYVHPAAPFAHPLDDGTAVTCERAIDQTAEDLGEDKAAYRKIMEPIVRQWDQLIPMLLAPPRLPAHPIILGRFGWAALQSAAGFAQRHFRGVRARALFAGAAAHAILPFDWLGSTAFGLMMHASAHAVGWPLVRGGSQQLADGMAKIFQGLGGEIQTGTEVRSLKDLPPAKAIVCDLSPRQVAGIAGDRLPAGYLRKLNRFQYGPGVFKLDWALSAPIPWRADACRRAATVHIGGTFEQIAAGEAACWRGEHVERPFVLLVQPTLFDATRAPAGAHTAWAYCHVPNGSTVDMTRQIEAQVDRFAPGFRDVILARSTLDCAAMQRHNPNLQGGDITGGAQMLRQVISRPRLFSPYATPLRGLYICSASTPPGAGVHGMCGFNAARAALARMK